MADASASGKPARGRGRAKAAAANENAEPTEPTESGEATEPVTTTDADDATVPPEGVASPAPGSASRRRWSVPFLLFLLVLLAAMMGWVFGVVSYRDKQDTEEQLDELQQSDAAATTELEERIAELDARLEELESGEGGVDERIDDLQGRIDDCAAETEALIELFQDAFGGDDVDEDAFDEQAGRTQRVCAEVFDDLGIPSDEDDTSSSPPTTTLPSE